MRTAGDSFRMRLVLIETVVSFGSRGAHTGEIFRASGYDDRKRVRIALSELVELGVLCRELGSGDGRPGARPWIYRHGRRLESLSRGVALAAART